MVLNYFVFNLDYKIGELDFGGCNNRILWNNFKFRLNFRVFFKGINIFIVSYFSKSFFGDSKKGFMRNFLDREIMFFFLSLRIDYF